MDLDISELKFCYICCRCPLDLNFIIPMGLLGRSGRAGQETRNSRATFKQALMADTENEKSLQHLPGN
jgi:hypothetical protein